MTTSSAEIIARESYIDVVLIHGKEFSNHHSIKHAKLFCSEIKCIGRGMGSRTCGLRVVVVVVVVIVNWRLGRDGLEKDAQSESTVRTQNLR